MSKTPSLLHIVEDQQAKSMRFLDVDAFREAIVAAGQQFDSVYEIYRNQMATADLVDLCQTMLQRIDRLEDELGICDEDEECDE